jgi:LysR family transcriptional regulator, transcriptional activator of the cysJI operon
MHIETLKIFCDLVETQSFSLTAEKNFITQSAVSQQIRSLEKRFSRRLVDRVRGKREIRLTPAGEVFYRASKRVLESYDQLQESMRSLTGTISGKIRVATVYSVGLHELPPKVREFMSKFPAVKIDIEYLRTTRVVRDVLSGNVDLGIIAFPEPKRGLTIVPMPSDRLVLICPPNHELASKKKVKAIELHGRDFVMFERDIPTRKAIDRILKSHGVEVNKVSEFDNIETIKRAVEVGFGLAIVPYPSVVDEEKNGQLVVVQLAEKDWVRPVGIIYRSDRNLSIAARKFIQLLENKSATSSE